MGHSAGRRVGSPDVLGADQIWLADAHPPRIPTSRPKRTGLSPELFRSRRVRTVGWRPSPDRIRMGARRERCRHRRQLRNRWPLPPSASERIRCVTPTALRRRLGMDIQLLWPVSRIRPRRGSGRRIQRQVHGEPVRAARWVLRYLRRPYPPDLPQLLPRTFTMDVLGTSAGANPYQ